MLRYVRIGQVISVCQFKPDYVRLYQVISGKSMLDYVRTV